MEITIRFCWYDMWVGAFWSRPTRRLYLCIVPMFPIVIDFP